MSQEFKEEQLPYLLPLYYKRLFPSLAIYRWLSDGKAVNFSRREISFTLIGDIYVRYQSFETHKDFLNELCKKFPIKIDIGSIYLSKPKLKNILTSLIPISKEIVFDIDMTDYDEIRTCCAGANVCSKCWKWMVIASRIIDTALREDFGFKNILWVFSGRRGIHAWVSDENARNLDDNVRSAIVEYLHVIEGGIGTTKKVNLIGNIHPSLKRALSIIDKYFMDCIVKEQKILESKEKLESFLAMIEEEIRGVFREKMNNLAYSMDRWKIFESTFMELQQKGQIPRSAKNLIEELKLYYAYPRLDINVSKSLNHLLKAPFCVHPKTGKICIPFNLKNADNFDPNNVPTITQLMEEVDAYDKKTKEQELVKMETDDNSVNRVTIKDIKKTSLLGPVNTFYEFLRCLEADKKK